MIWLEDARYVDDYRVFVRFNDGNLGKIGAGRYFGLDVVYGS